jgi:UDP-N-acetylmuramate dehydrogenase
MTPQSDVALAPYCTMAVGGPARWFVDARTEADISAAFEWARQRQLPVFVLGGGSNVVIADQGLEGLVVRVQISGVEATRVADALVYRVGAGEPWDDFVAATVDANAAGLECLSGIPGLAGGTPVQNVGAYGQDVSGTIQRVRAIDRRAGRPVEFSNEQCTFTYRNSRFKSGDADHFVVTSVVFALRPDAPATVAYADVVTHFEQVGNRRPSLREVRDAVLTIRRRKGMVIESGNPASQSCGSFFVNPVVAREQAARVKAIADAHVPTYSVDAQRVKIPAAWLIEHAGFPRGTTRGAVGVSPFQAQAIVNRGGAQAGDVVALACDIKRAVLDTFGVSLVPEPVLMGFPPSPSVSWLLEPYVNASH